MIAGCAGFCAEVQTKEHCGAQMRIQHLDAVAVDSGVQLPPTCREEVVESAVPQPTLTSGAAKASTVLVVKLLFAGRVMIFPPRAWRVQASA